MNRGVALLVAFVLYASLVASCSSQATTPTSPVAGPGPTTVVVRIVGFDEGVAVVGTSVALSAVVTLSDGNQTTMTDGPIWRSSNEAIGRVDAHGVLTALAEGVTVVSAAVKDAVASRTFDVVNNVAGDWTFSFIGTTCNNDLNPGCRSGQPWTTDGAKIRLTQIGSHVDGTWQNNHYFTGRMPFAGRINTDGTLDLAAAYCSLNDVNHGTRYSLRGWHMDRAADGSYSGRVSWERGIFSPVYSNGCEGDPLSVIVEDLIVTNFRRGG
jgi:hypothetical protein